jgi:hypothetical protein
VTCSQQVSTPPRRPGPCLRRAEQQYRALLGRWERQEERLREATERALAGDRRALQLREATARGRLQGEALEAALGLQWQWQAAAAMLSRPTGLPGAPAEADPAAECERAEEVGRLALGLQEQAEAGRLLWEAQRGLGALAGALEAALTASAADFQQAVALAAECDAAAAATHAAERQQWRLAQAEAEGRQRLLLAQADDALGLSLALAASLAEVPAAGGDAPADAAHIAELAAERNALAVGLSEANARAALAEAEAESRLALMAAALRPPSDGSSPDTTRALHPGACLPRVLVWMVSIRSPCLFSDVMCGSDPELLSIFATQLCSFSGNLWHGCPPQVVF